METKVPTEEAIGSKQPLPTGLEFHNGNMTPEKYGDATTKSYPVSVMKGHHDPNTPSTSHKSPVHVRFGACGFRSDAYLRQVLASPYHKSSSPMSVHSDTGSPIVFKTPNRDRLSSPSSAHAKTPSSSYSHYGISSHVTPQSRGICNPFDEADDRVHFPGFSPGLFTVMSTPAGEDGKSFRWSIEHIAALNPANIEEMPHQLDHGLDKEAEERAQRAISHFFASQLIAPSPWNAPERKYIPPCTPVSQSGANRPTQMFPEDLQGSIQKELSKLRRSQDASCQTTLSLPVDFDVQSILAEHMTTDVPEETNQEALSTSSLRRKLFFQGDTSTTLSPVKGAVRLEELTSPPVSPLRQTTPEWDKQAYRTSSSSGHFSSSPIKGPSEHLPFFRTTSEAEYLASPELSPINKKRTNRATVYRSSGCGVPNAEESFTFNTDNIKQHLSPLPMPDMSPISSEPMRDGDIQKQLSPLSMPDMSPISCGAVSQHGDTQQWTSPLPMPDMSPIPQCESNEEQRDLGASYLPEQSSEQMSNDSSTPQAADFRDRVTSPAVTCPPIQAPVMAFRESTAMDIESSSLDCFQFKTDNRTCTFNAEQDLSVDEMDTTGDYLPQRSSSNQDTGYQTASLQLTNHDTGLHTNLTSHFNSLPFKTENSIDRNDLEDSLAASKVCPRVCLDFDQQSDSDGKDMDCGQGDSGLSEEDVLERARQALALANNRCPPQTCDLDSSQSSLPIEPISSSTPTKRSVRRIERKIAIIKKPSGNGQLASDMAKELLKRAGEDLAKFTSKEKQVSAS